MWRDLDKHLILVGAKQNCQIFANTRVDLSQKFRAQLHNEMQRQMIRPANPISGFDVVPVVTLATVIASVHYFDMRVSFRNQFVACLIIVLYAIGSVYEQFHANKAFKPQLTKYESLRAETLQPIKPFTMKLQMTLSATPDEISVALTSTQRLQWDIGI